MSAPVFQMDFIQDIKRPIMIQHCGNLVFTGDNLSDTVSVSVLEDGEPYAISGTVSMNCIRADGATVTVTGSVSGNTASATLTQACVAIPGPLAVVMKVTSGTTTTTLLKAVYMVDVGVTGTAVDPGTIIPDVTTLINAIETAVGSIPADYSDLLATLAPNFVSGTYTEGQYVWNNGTLYRFTDDHSGSWTGTDVESVVIGDELTNLKSAMTQAQSDIGNNATAIGEINTALGGKQDTLTFDNAPTANSNNPVKSGGVYTAVNGKVNKPSGNGTAGQFLETNGDGTTQWADPLAGGVTEAVSDWLENHPEATTTVEDGAITLPKLNANLVPEVLNNGYFIPASSISNNLGILVNAAFESNDVVIIPAGNYTLDTEIYVPSGKTLISFAQITYNGTNAAIDIHNCLYTKVYVHTVNALNGSCIRISADSTNLNEFNEIHSRYLYGKICIDIRNTGSKGIQHINIYSNYIRATQKGVSIVSTEASGWCGEIKFYGGEINGTNAVGLYTAGQITAIRMFGVGFESLTNSVDITDGANETTLYGCRFEGAGQIILAGTFRACIFDGDIFSYTSLDVTNHVGSTIFRGRIMSAPNGNQIGNEMIITGSVPSITGTIDNAVAYAIYSNGATIGGNGIFPVVARLNATDGIYYLSDKYQINGGKSLIVFCEKTNITLKNADGSRTLFTSGNTQECYRITSISNNNSYFCPTGYLVEKITPIK